MRKSFLPLAVVAARVGPPRRRVVAPTVGPARVGGGAASAPL